MNKSTILKVFIAYFFLTVITFFWLIPIIWMVLASLMPFENIISVNLALPSFTFENYRQLFLSEDFFKYFSNSLWISLLGTVTAVFFGSMTAHISLRNKTFKRYFLYWIVSTRIIPPSVFLLPLYILFKSIGLLNNLVTLAIMGFIINYSLVVWLMRSVFKQIPRDMEFSAIIDGASRLKAFSQTTLRYSFPGLLLVSIFTWLFIWNEYLISMVLTVDAKAQPLSILLGQSLSHVRVDWGRLFSVGVIELIPVILFITLLNAFIKIKKIDLSKFNQN